MKIELPSLPQTLVQLIDACNDPDRDIASVGLIVSRDAPLAARVLQLANSAFLGARSSFTDIGQAVIYLGMDTLRNLAISISVHDAFSTEQSNSRFNFEEFWFHSLFCAVIAKELAERSRYNNPSEAYLAGLLHDIGKCLLNSSFPDLFPETRGKTVGEILATEKKLFGKSHAEAGADLVRHWHLEDRIAESIHTHHDHADSAEEPGRLSLLLNLANQLTVDITKETCSLARKLGEWSGERIDKNSLKELRDEMKETVSQVAASLGIHVNEPAADNDTTEDRPDNRENVRRRAEHLSQMTGMLDNLLRAETIDRGFQIVEETLMILFGLDKTILLIPKERGKDLVPTGSSRNQLLGAIPPSPVSLKSLMSTIEDQAPQPHHPVIFSAKKNEEINKLFQNVSGEKVIAQGFTIDNNNRGFLLIALESDEFEFIENSADSLSLLSAQVGSWLKMKMVQEQHAQELIEEQISTMKGVARAISHEISTPLSTIRNYLFLLKNRLTDEAEVVDEITRIDSEIERIGTISEQLRDLSPHHQNESGIWFDLNDIISEVVKLFQQANDDAEKVNISFSRCQGLARINSSPDTIRQILNNLISNSLDAVDKRGRIRVSLKLSQNQYGDEKIHITVADNGKGISSTHADEIFRPGYTTKRGNHSGFGLSIVRKLAKDLGGTIRVHDNQQRGAAFTLELPFISEK